MGYEGVIYRKEQDIRNQNIRRMPLILSLPFPGGNHKSREQLNPPGVHAVGSPDVA